MTDAPLNPLETVIRAGAAGRATAAELHAAFLEATLLVPSATEVKEDFSGLSPLILPTPRSETGMVVAFTDGGRITPEAAAQAPHCLQLTGGVLVALIGGDLGILIVAGADAAAELDPATLADLRESLAD